MKYKFTQLKDLPNSPAGTVYLCREIVSRWECNSDMSNYDYYQIIVGDYIREYKVGSSIFDNPDWFKKEIDFEHLDDLKCPVCGETRWTFVCDSYYQRDYDLDSCGVNFEVGFECICGHVRLLTKKGELGGNIKYTSKDDSCPQP